jgi:hypothetical protein
MAARSRNKIKTNLGSGALCKVIYNFLHPKKLMDETFINHVKKDHVHNLIALRVETKKIKGRERACIVFRHESVLENKELYACIPYVHVTTPGPPEHFFNVPNDSGNLSADLNAEASVAAADNTNEAQVVVEEAFEGVELPTNAIHHRSTNREDINYFRDLGLDVDDDNEPVPENVPPPVEPQAETTPATTNDVNGLKPGQSWGWSGLDPRKASGFCRSQPKIFDHNSEDLKNMTILWWFLLFLGWPIISLVITCTNKCLDRPTHRGEFLRFLGLWFLMATIGGGFDKMEYWSTAPVDKDSVSGAPYRFNDWMSRNRFLAILSALRFTNENPPPYVDRFFQIRQMIRLWNENIQSIFKPGWLTCLDESMSIWFSKWTCPGWVFCPRKPHPFGNEYHSICCALSGIMFGIELVEGKDHPNEIPRYESDRFGNTVGLLIRLTKPLWATASVVILDSGFCILKGIIELKKLGVYASALIKKRRYWPRDVPGDAMDNRLRNKGLGSTDAIYGKSEDVDYHFFMEKDKDYTIKLMSTYSSLNVNDKAKHNRRHITNEQGKVETTTFQHAESFEHYYEARHKVDDHNHARHLLPSLEATWVTTTWENRVFAFILAISEINAWLAYKFFVLIPQGFALLTIHQFRRKLALALIYNDYIVMDSSAGSPRTSQRISGNKRKASVLSPHILRKAPQHAKFFDHAREIWDVSAKDGSQRYNCSMNNCTNRTRKYCECNIGLWICEDCFGFHCFEAGVASVTP